MSTEPKSFPMSMRLSAEVLDALRARAAAEDRPVASMAAHLIKVAVLPPKQPDERKG